MERAAQLAALFLFSIFAPKVNYETYTAFYNLSTTNFLDGCYAAY